MKNRERQIAGVEAVLYAAWSMLHPLPGMSPGHTGDGESLIRDAIKATKTAADYYASMAEELTDLEKIQNGGGK